MTDSKGGLQIKSRDIVDLLRDALERDTGQRVYGGDLTIAMMATPCSVPMGVLNGAIKEIEHLRSVAGAVTDGDSFADIRKAIKQS